PADQVVGSEAFLEHDPWPGRKEPDHLGSQVGGQPGKLAYHQELAFPVLRYGAGEIVVRRHARDLQSLAFNERSHPFSGSPFDVNGVAMRALAVQLDPVVTAVLCALDDLLEAQRRAVLPATHARSALYADF